MLLVFGAPCQHSLLAGREHGRTIPLAEAGARGRMLSALVGELLQPPARWDYDTSVAYFDESPTSKAAQEAAHALPCSEAEHAKLLLRDGGVLGVGHAETS